MFRKRKIVERRCAPRAGLRRLGRADEGYAAVDAIVALSVVALALVGGLTAMGQAGQVSAAAAELQSAKLLLSRLADAEPKRLEGSAGQTAGFVWTVQTQPTGDTALIDICRRQVRVTARQSGRAYDLLTLVTCPPKLST